MTQNTTEDITENPPEPTEKDSRGPNNSHESKDNGTSDQDEKGGNRYKPGQVLTFVRVRFPGNAKSHAFLVGKRKFQYGQKVLALSDRGTTIGYINSFPYEVEFRESMLPVRSISKVATDEDIVAQQDFQKKENEAERLCLKLIERYKLDMIVTHVEYIQFGKKAVFYFTAPARVDFRNLVKDLVSDLKMRIELRQISVRDRTAALGATGVCGLQTCCSSFLQAYGNVNIRMAKNQNLALIPSKINGVCGQLKCCIKYEDEVYGFKRTLLPREGSFTELRNGDRGKVLRLHLLIEQFDLLTEKGQKRRYTSSLYDKAIKLPDSWRFPTEFKTIDDETSEVIEWEEEEEETEDNQNSNQESEENQPQVESNKSVAPEEKPTQNNNNNSDNRNQTNQAQNQSSSQNNQEKKPTQGNNNNKKNNHHRGKNRNKKKQGGNNQQDKNKQNKS